MKRYILSITLIAIIIVTNIICLEKSGTEAQLFTAIDNNNLYAVKSLLNSGNNVNQINNPREKKTPLHYAVLRNNIGIVKELLQYRANINVQDGDGITPLHMAIDQTDKYNNTSLCHMLFGNSLNLVRLLLDHKADVDKQDKHGFTPLHKAATISNVSVVKLLLPYTPNVHLEDNDGYTALNCAFHINDMLRPTSFHIESNMVDGIIKDALNSDAIIMLLLNLGANANFISEDIPKKILLNKYASLRSHEINKTLKLPSDINNLIQQYAHLPPLEHLFSQRLTHITPSGDAFNISNTLSYGMGFISDIWGILNKKITEKLPRLITTQLSASTDENQNIALQSLLQAINENNVDDVKNALLHHIDITDDIIQAAKNKIILLFQPNTDQRFSCREKSGTIFKLLIEQKLLQAIDKNKVNEVRKTLSIFNGITVADNIIKIAEMKSKKLKTSALTKSDANNIIILLKEYNKNLVAQNLLEAINKGNVCATKKALSDGAKVTDDIKVVAQNRVEQLLSSTPQQLSRNIKNAFKILSLLNNKKFKKQ